MDQLREKRHKYNEGWSDRELFSKLSIIVLFIKRNIH